MPSLDEQRWELITLALREPRLTDAAKLIAIGTIVRSRDVYSTADIQRAHELAKRFGWKRVSLLRTSRTE